MEEKKSKRDLFSVATGKTTIVVPEKVTVECLKPANTPSGKVRPSVSFNPSDPESVARARRAVSRHNVPPRVCGEHCDLACTLRRLENSNDNRLMATFNKGNLG